MPSRRRRELSGAGVQLASEVSINFGSAVAGLLIPVVGVVAVVAARQLVTVVTLSGFWRPTRERMSWRRLWPAVALGVALAAMNLSFYEAVGILGLGIAAVLEFLGPFALAIAGSRRLVDVVCAIGAAGGVVLLTGASGRVSLVGVVFALVAAAAWAAYILLTRRVALGLPGLEGLTVASMVALVIVVPWALVTIDWAAFTPSIWLMLLGLGVLSSAVPYSLDSYVLRRITARIYAVLTSFGPAIAAVFGVLVLGERFDGLEVVGIALVCACGAITVLAQRPTSQQRPGTQKAGEQQLPGLPDGSAD